MTDQHDSQYSTHVETNRWESFTRLTFVYFADEGYEVEQGFEDGHYRLTFTDENRDETAEFAYTGSGPEMAQESLQQMQKLFEGTEDLVQLWQSFLKSETQH